MQCIDKRSNVRCVPTRFEPELHFGHNYMIELEKTQYALINVRTSDVFLHASNPNFTMDTITRLN
jgi:hypothetical protein